MKARCIAFGMSCYCLSSRYLRPEPFSSYLAQSLGLLSFTDTRPAYFHQISMCFPSRRHCPNLNTHIVVNRRITIEVKFGRMDCSMVRSRCLPTVRTHLDIISLAHHPLISRPSVICSQTPATPGGYVS